MFLMFALIVGQRRQDTLYLKVFDTSVSTLAFLALGVAGGKASAFDAF